MTVALGRDIAFAINAASFFASALFIGRTRYDANPAAGRPPLRGLAALTGVSDLVEGIRYVRHRSHVGALIFVKAGWGLAGGVLLLLTIFGQRVFPVAGSTAAGIGVLYGARGLGAGLGPIALRWILGQKPQTLRRTIGPAYFMVGVFYVALAGAPTLPIAALFVMLAHFGGSILWVFSTVLLQMEVPDRFRGRVFATELALVTLTSSISSYWTGFELDHAGWSPRMLSFALGVMFCVPGALWLLIQSRWREAELEPLTQSDAAESGEEEVLEGLESANAYSTVSLDAPDSGEEDAPAVADSLGMVDDALEGVEYRESLKPLLEQLPPREKKILLLRFFGNMTQSQIAAELGISQMHVSRLLARTLTQLREGLTTED